MNRGRAPAGHTEECRRWVQQELQRAGDPRIEREDARALKYFNEQFGEKLEAGQEEKDAKKPRRAAAEQAEVEAKEADVMSDGTAPTVVDGDLMETLQADEVPRAGLRKREVDEAWDEFAKRLRSGAEAKRSMGEPKGEMDVNAVIREINAVLDQAVLDEDRVILSLKHMSKEQCVEEEKWG